MFRLHVRTQDPDDARILAEAINDVYRHDNLTRSTRNAQSLIGDLERKVREHRQDVAAIDIRIKNIINDRQLTGTIEQTAQYQERAILITRLAETRAELATLPAQEEEGGSDRAIATERRSLEALESRLARRIEALNKELKRHMATLTDMNNLRTERAQRMQRIGDFERIIADLSLLMDRGSRIRVVSPPTTPDTRSFPALLPIVGISVAFFGLSGMVVSTTRG